MLIEQISRYPHYQHLAKQTKLIDVTATSYYGEGYQDVFSRVPSIALASQYLDWHPRVPMADALRLTLNYHLANPQYKLTTEAPCLAT